MAEINVAVARFARHLSKGLLELAQDLEAGSSHEVFLDRPEIPEARGQRQGQILELAGLASEEGLKTADIGAAINYDVPNAYNTLQALERNGLVEQVSGATPQRWRLAERYRTTAAVFMRMARRVRTGEWTTYGDISIAVRDDTKASRGVGRAAAAIRDFPNPHRILMQDGTVAPGWTDHESRGPDYCRALLETEAIAFDANGRADPTKKVDWAELRRRDQSEPVD